MESHSEHENEGMATKKNALTVRHRPKVPSDLDGAGQHSHSEQFLIAALGASACGLEALETFFQHMPADADIAFAIVMHLAADHESALTQLLARHTRMSVEQVRDNTKIVPNRIYIIPPNATLTIENCVLRVRPPTEPRGYRTPIDSLFVSLAEDRGEMAVCIMLSGTGTDGTLGLRAIKEHGGMAIAQTLESAKHDAILRSAIATGLVDHVLLPAGPYPETPGTRCRPRACVGKAHRGGAGRKCSRRQCVRIGKHLLCIATWNTPEFIICSLGDLREVGTVNGRRSANRLSRFVADGPRR
jgi:chemotaxis response regulator CheB